MLDSDLVGKEFMSYEGEIYTIICIATIEPPDENLEAKETKLVIYQNKYNTFAREYYDFFGIVFTEQRGLIARFTEVK